MRRRLYNGVVVGLVCAGLIGLVAYAQNLTPQSYLPVVITEDFPTTMERDKAAKSEVLQRQMALLGERYDWSDRPAAGMMMSGGRKPVSVCEACSTNKSTVLSVPSDQLRISRSSNNAQPISMVTKSPLQAQGRRGSRFLVMR
jgi:hypothetical protein